MSLVLGPQPRVRPVDGPFVVRALRAYVIGDKATEEAAGGGADCHSQSHGACRGRSRGGECEGLAEPCRGQRGVRAVC